MSENDLVRILLFWNKCFTKDMHLNIMQSSIRFINDSKRFDEGLFS